MTAPLLLDLKITFEWELVQQFALASTLIRPSAGFRCR